MAKTVAEIDGDSSGLVSELGKAAKSMGGLAGEGKKLTDQLKQVADEADVAAGKLVNELGGPGAIKAIGGVGIAFTAIKGGVDAFLDSSEKMFRSYGQDGQAVWDQVEQSLNGIQGSFAKVILGSDDLYTAGGRLQAMFGLVQDAVDALLSLLSPLTIAFQGLLELTTDYSDKVAVNSAKLREQAKAQADVKKAADDNAASIQTLTEKYLALTGQSDILYDHQLAQYQLQARITAQNILDEERASDKAEAMAAVADRQVEINKLVEDAVALNAQYGAIEDSQEAREAERVRQTKIRTDEALAEELRKREGMSASRKAEYDQATKMYLEFERMRMTGFKPAEGTDKTGTGGGGGGKKELSAQERIAAALDAAKKEADALATLKEQNDKSEQQLEMDKLKREAEILEASIAQKEAAMQRVNDFAKKMEEEHDAEIHARGELTVAEQEERNAAILASVKERTGQELGLYMQVAGKQLAIGELSAKKAAELARQQLGNIIMGLGDKAMAEAGIMAAALNPLAVPMAAAGVAAYAIGGALSADKKAAGSTPSTQKAEATQPTQTNYAYNLRIDSVFADGESVARQFAMMQESARQRGLLTQGAY